MSKKQSKADQKAAEAKKAQVERDKAAADAAYRDLDKIRRAARITRKGFFGRRK